MAIRADQSVTLTQGELRQMLKAAFYAGFHAHKPTAVVEAWEESDLRSEIDYGGKFDSLSFSTASSPATEASRRP